MADLLDHPTRKRIHEIIIAHPGITEADLCRMLAVGRNNVRFHLSAMLRAGLLARDRVGRRSRYYPDRPLLSTQRRALAAVQDRTKRTILEMLQQKPAMSWRALARDLGVTPRAVRWQVQEMTKMGLLHVGQEDHHPVSITPATVDAMQEWQEGSVAAQGSNALPDAKVA